MLFYYIIGYKLNKYEEVYVNLLGKFNTNLMLKRSKKLDKCICLDENYLKVYQETWGKCIKNKT